MAYMCMLIFLMNATACIDDIQIETVKAHITVIIEIRLYPAESPMPRASEAPFALVDIARCSKSRTTVDAGRCSQCSPTNGSPGRRRLDILGRRRIQERSPAGRRWTSSRGSLPKNLIAAHPVQDSQATEGSGGTCSPALHACRGTGQGSQKAADLWFSRKWLRKSRSELTEDRKYIAAAGKEERQRRIPGDESGRDTN